MELPENLADTQQAAAFSMPNEWWRSFDDERLDILVQAGLEDNLTLAQMWQRVEQARYAAEIAGADLLPSVDLSGEASRSRGLTANDKKTYSTLYSTGFLVNYELDIWGRVAANAAAGVYRWQAGEQDFQAARISIAAQIANAWFNYLETAQLLEIINYQIKINEDTLDIITMQFKRGGAEAADVLQQRQLLESTKGQRTQLLALEDVYKTTIALLTGKAPGTTDIPPASGLPELKGFVPAGSITELIERRPDIQSAYLRVMAYDQSVAAATADKMPRITLGAAAITSDSRLKGLFDSWQSEIAAQLTMPIFDAGLTEAQIERQKALRQEAVEAYIETVYNAVKEVRDAVSREKNQQEYVDSLQKQLKLSKQAVERIHDSYTKGGTDFLRLLSAQLSDRNLELSLVSAQKDLLSFRIDLYKALAGNIEDEDITDNG
jgi:NodT family efflux transporter outer membrane factor (OMF) lipoprotein